MKIIVKNLATEYSDEGTGHVLLFLHGWQDTLHTFDALCVSLVKTHRVVRLDLPGFGHTDTPKQVWTLDEYIAFVDEFIKKLQLDVDTIVGHSFGGRIIIKGASTKKIHTKKIILIASAGIAQRQTLRTATLKIIAKIGGILLCVPPLFFWRDTLRRQFYSAIGSDYLSAGALQKTFLNIIAHDLSQYARMLSLPTLLIWGDHDIQTPLSDGKRLTKMIPGSHLDIISDTGHFVHKERPLEVLRTIQKFL
ncbi:MAG: alpha/beta hydrolase [bacterium]|nr:alpha/beta hydrolase [bacterium]